MAEVEPISPTYTAPPYSATTITGSYHALPRFGHTSALSSLASFDDDEQVSYALGLILLTSVVLCFFVFWNVAIITLAVMGSDQVGFWAGRGFVQPLPRCHSTYTYGSYRNAVYKRPRRVRITFLLCGVLVMVFSVLFVTHGLSQVEQTQLTLKESNYDIRELTAAGKEIAEQLRNVGEAAEPIRAELVSRLKSGFCPGDPELVKQSGYDFGGMARDGIEYLNVLSDFVTNDVSEMEDALNDINAATDEVDRYMTQYDISTPLAMGYVIPTIVLTSLLIFAVMLSWCRIHFHYITCFVRWGIVPLFVLAIVFSWIMVSIFGLLTTANSDACSPSPDATIFAILEEQALDDPRSIVYQAVRYYVDRCVSPPPFDFLDEYQNELSQAIGSVDVLQNTVDSIGLDELENLCGTDLAPVKDLLTDVGEKLVILSESAIRVKDLISCESINPIYVNLAHRAMCEESASGLSWMFASFMVISICGMTMLTLRSALYEDITLDAHAGAFVNDLNLAQDSNSKLNMDEKKQAISRARSTNNGRSNSRESSKPDNWDDNDWANPQPTRSRSTSHSAAGSRVSIDADEEGSECSYDYPVS